MPTISQFNFLEALGWALINSLWQMALLWVVFKLLLSLFTNLKPGKKASIASCLIIVGFSWFLFTFISAFLKNSSNDLYNNRTAFTNASGWGLFIERVLSFGSVAYLIFLVIPVWKFIHNYHYVQDIRHNGLSKINAEWKIFVNKTAANIGISRKVKIWLSELVQTPVTIGFLKPVILLPVAAINQLTTQQVEAIILHELHHILRFDYLFNLIINFVKTILYFNPFVNQLIKTIERESESSCDEMVIQYQYQPADYASALLILGKNIQSKLLMAASAKNKDLLYRVESILGIGQKVKFNFRQISITILTLFFIASMNIVFNTNAKTGSLSHLVLANDVNPYYFFNSFDIEGGKSQPLLPLNKIQILKNKNSEQIVSVPFNEENEFSNFEDASGFYTANMTTAVIPQLALEHELKLKQTIGATKKILEEKEWKELEKKSADVFNSFEKEKLKNEYQKEVKNIDWDKLNDQLRLAYDNINWQKVNEQINTSLAQIKLDSIQQQVNLALNNLNKLELWMKENNTTCIPDSDVSLRLIVENQQKAKAQLEKIKVNRNKKVVKI